MIESAIARYMHLAGNLVFHALCGRLPCHKRTDLASRSGSSMYKLLCYGFNPSVPHITYLIKYAYAGVQHLSQAFSLPPSPVHLLYVWHGKGAGGGGLF